jgi:hypothetical protein
MPTSAAVIASAVLASLALAGCGQVAIVHAVASEEMSKWQPYTPSSGRAPFIPSPDVRQRVGRLAATTTNVSPEVNFPLVQDEQLPAAFSNAAGATGECLRIAGKLGILAVLAVPVFCPAAAIGGFLAGGASVESGATPGPPPLRPTQALLHEHVSRHLADLNQAFPSLQLDPDSSAIVPGDDYDALARIGVDTALESSVITIALKPYDAYPPPLQAAELVFQMEISARVRLVRVRDREVLFDEVLRFAGARRAVRDWTAHEGRPLRDELERGYRELGRHVIEFTLMLYPFPGRNAGVAGEGTYAFGLAPLDPRTEGGRLIARDANPIDNRAWGTVMTLQPLLQWEKFPRAADVKLAGGEMAQVRDVRYELAIAVEEHLAAGAVIYRRDGLQDNAHRVEIPLEHLSRYFWSVRARFELDGRTYVSEWGRVSPYGGQDVGPDGDAYRFFVFRRY